MSDNLRLDRSFRPTAARNVIARGHRLLDKLDAERFTRRDTELLVTANALLLGIATQQEERVERRCDGCKWWADFLDGLGACGSEAFATCDDDVPPTTRASFYCKAWEAQT